MVKVITQAFWEVSFTKIQNLIIISIENLNSSDNFLDFKLEKIIFENVGIEY